MGPRKTETTGSGDLFRARLDQIIDMRHELARLADAIDWAWIDGALAGRFGLEGRPATEARFMVGFLLLKHIYGLSDEGVRALGGEPVFPVLHRGRVLPARLPAGALGAQSLASSDRRLAGSAAGGEPAGGP